MSVKEERLELCGSLAVVVAVLRRRENNEVRFTSRSLRSVNVGGALCGGG
jgi:hypothetical protein